MRFAGHGLVLAFLVSVFFTVTASAAPDATTSGGSTLRQAQVLEVDRIGVASPVGLAFAADTKSFHVVGARQGGAAADTDVVRLTPFALSPVSDRAGSARIAAAVKDPVNVAFDARGGRLLLLDSANRLLEVRTDANGDLDSRTLVRRDALRLDLQDPQGMTVDPSGTAFILDAAQPRLLRVEPAADGGFDRALITEIDLRPSGLGGVRGLAIDPLSGHFQLRSARSLVELTTTGEVVATRDLSGLELTNPEGMTFAPSGDPTDDPGQQSVYVADSGSVKSSGQIMEVSLVPLVAIAAIDFVAELKNTIDTAAFSPPGTPPSPDPSGLTYLPAPRDTLVMVDGEVEETVNGITHFQGVNVWEMTRTGHVVDTANISKVAPTSVPMTQEPVGVTWQPGTEHFFVTEDGGKKVYNLNPGGDGNIGTPDDTFTSFSTTANGNSNGDPEGIAYDTSENRLWVADGVGAEIYHYETNGTLLGHFDVQAFGVADPETVEYNAASNTLFVLSNRQSGPIIIEVTTGGALLKTIDVSSAIDHRPAGLAYAPASDGSGAMRFYWCDREIDNNNDPRIIDGKIFEFTAPSTGPPVNAPPVVDAGPNQTIVLPASASLNGTVTDDNLPNPPATVTTNWTEVSGPGTVTFGNANAVDTTATFSTNGTYVLQLEATDSALTTTDTVTITVNPAGSNQAPSVNAGLDQTIALPASAALDATVTDDGQPGPLTTTWSETSGPGTVTFGDVNAVDTTATFSDTGTYVLHLSAFDGALTSFDEVTVTVSAATLYFSAGTAQTLNGVAVTPQDIVAFNGSSFSLLLDGSDVGLESSTENIDALAVLPGGSILVSTVGSYSVPGLSGQDEDVIALSPGVRGMTSTGTWSMYFDGGNAGLTASGEDVDAFEVHGGQLLISTAGAVSVGTVTGGDKDVLAFTPGTGLWEMYFNGSDVGLTTSGEDIDGVALDAGGNIYLSTRNSFGVANLSGADEDVFSCNSPTPGTTTACASFSLIFDGSLFGLAGNDLFAIELP
ncbi:MAG: PKD domain-containing protein [Gaiellaceae bacterium]